MSQQAYKILISIWLLFTTVTAFGVPAIPTPITRTQPDGTQLTTYLKGDEFHKYELTLDGYLIRKDVKGYYKYAIQATDGTIISTGIKANPKEKRTIKEQQLVKTLTKFPNFTKQNHAQRMAKAAAQSADGIKQKNFPITGSPKSIVILVNFKDVAFTIPDPNTAFTNLLNQAGYSDNGGTGSARDYFKVASNGASTPEFVVVGPYTLPNNREYYGKNDSTDGDNDVNPRGMVIHACEVAASNGVNFADYDSDNDGHVDNVFIYYAGHNEAEGGPKESVWPHRWFLKNYLTLHGKNISDYACTSELSGRSGTTMCGIGTFCHEFGHVYGLPDYYITDPSVTPEHHTLSTWNIMDAGAYNNKGKTPPTYSAYDRFFLGWLTPTLLNSPSEVVLNELQSSNQAYIITQDGTHNLNGARPQPLEFFTLENRQRIGWDAYLPNSGMLITRINYNVSMWAVNGPNNSASAMGVDIIEADGYANETTKRGDPFPGSSNITSYTPKLRSGMDIAKPLTDIKETNGIITFKFMGGRNPLNLNADLSTLTPFTTEYGTPSVAQEFTISGKNIPIALDVDFFTKQHFELKRKDDPSNHWVKNLSLATVDSILESTTLLLRYNPTEPSFKQLHTDYLKITVNDVVLAQTVIAGTSSRPVFVVPPVAAEPTSVSLNGLTANWSQVVDATGYYLSVYNQSEGTTTLKEGFNNGLIPPSGWIINASSIFSQENYAGDSIPSIQLQNTGSYIQTEVFDFPVTEFSFYIRSIGEISGILRIAANKGEGWEPLDSIAIGSTLKTIKTYQIDPNNGYRQFKIVFTKGIASIAIDDVAVKLAQQVTYINRNTWMTGNSYPIDMILPGRKYYYAVKASDKTYYSDSQILKYENITANSNIITVELDRADIVQYAVKNASIAVFKDTDGTVVLDKSKVKGINTHLIYLYSADGRLIETFESYNDLVSLTTLTKGQFYIVRVGNTSIKVVL